MKYNELQSKVKQQEERIAELEEREADLLKRVNTSIRNFAGTFRVRSGDIKSGNYEEGEQGWKLTPTKAYLPSTEIDGYLQVGDAASDINDGITTIDGDKITTGTVTADKLDVSKLDAISANIGDITAGSLDAVSITGSIITGSTVRTDSSGNQRVELKESTETHGNELSFFNSSDNYLGGIYWFIDNNILNIGSTTEFQLEADTLQMWTDSGDLNSDFNILPGFAGLNIGSSSNPWDRGYFTNELIMYGADIIFKDSDKNSGWIDSKPAAGDVNGALLISGGVSTSISSIGFSGDPDSVTPSDKTTLWMQCGSTSSDKYFQFNQQLLPSTGGLNIGSSSSNFGYVYASRYYIGSTRKDSNWDTAYTHSITSGTPHVTNTEKNNWNAKMDDVEDDTSPTLGGNLDADSNSISDVNALNLNARSGISPSSGTIINWSSGGTDQFRGTPGTGSWVGSFDMTAV